jgi:mannosyltransferase OCH1-like enzyme
MENKIPKIIHYCWFGKNPLPKLAQKCIKSWQKYCPDYQIIRWDETNFDINSNLYVKQAYEAKKYAFVSDYVRFGLYIIMEEFIWIRIQN